ncbi:ATP-binding protein [Candidatus Palauibacter sp.]|uniref:ATP-binding protein n=1 Tax=Candidatus Palauibacter sp. TaxID=3101350 RepID=UPI003B519FB2
MANALCHRDNALGGGSVGPAAYDDRLEVTSTGPLHFGLTPAALFGPHESRPWNPLIARTFYRCGIIEEWGRGTLKMAELATSAGLPRSEIEERDDCVTVCFRLGQAVPLRRALIERQGAMLALVDQADDGLALRKTRAQLALSASERQVKRALAAFEDPQAGSVRGSRSNGSVETCA